MMTDNTFVQHLIAGGAAGTANAIVTNPLEVVKTRLQSTTAKFADNGGSNPKVGAPQQSDSFIKNRAKAIRTTHTSIQSPFVHTPAFDVSRRWFSSLRPSTTSTSTAIRAVSDAAATAVVTNRPSILQCFRYVLRTEGSRAFFKGLGPSIIGIAPSRAIFFSTYGLAKEQLNAITNPESAYVHMLSAGIAGFCSCTLTNPIWVVKTRLQLDQHRSLGRLSMLSCLVDLVKQDGFKGLYRGVTASYAGISETMIHFVIYEFLKEALVLDGSDMSGWDALRVMPVAATSKMIASSIAYPHELARTRLRQPGSKYRGLFQTWRLTVLEEGWRGLYGGMGVNLIRQIPSTMVLMGTYELVVVLLRDNT